MSIIIKLTIIIKLYFDSTYKLVNRHTSVFVGFSNRAEMEAKTRSYSPARLHLLAYL